MAEVNAIDALASAILSEDITEVYEMLSYFLTAAQHKELGLLLELCPLHYCADEICRDDQAHCYEEDTNDVPRLTPS